MYLVNSNSVIAHKIVSESNDIMINVVSMELEFSSIEV